MPDVDRIYRVAREWIDKAENDLTTAVHVLDLGQACPTDTVCFHAQQCVEKYVKAYLVSKGIDFPQTHDTGALMALVPRDLAGSLSVEEQRRLTAYATTTRYPGEYEPISLSEARRAVATARRVRRAVRGKLPTAVVRRGAR